MSIYKIKIRIIQLNKKLIITLRFHVIRKLLRVKTYIILRNRKA